MNLWRDFLWFIFSGLCRRIWIINDFTAKIEWFDFYRYLTFSWINLLIFSHNKWILMYFFFFDWKFFTRGLRKKQSYLGLRNIFLPFKILWIYFVQLFLLTSAMANKFLFTSRIIFLDFWILFCLAFENSLKLQS